MPTTPPRGSSGRRASRAAGASPARADKDYSGTPLWRKLGIREGSRVLLVNAPPGFPELLGPLPPDATLLSRASKPLDVAVLFATGQAALGRGVARLAPMLHAAGRLWVAWPKKASGLPTDITFASAQGAGLDAGLVDNKSASLTETFQGLQFVYRLRDRPPGLRPLGLAGYQPVERHGTLA